MVLQIYMNLAIFASSWLVIVPPNRPNFDFDPLALISSSLWVTSNILYIFALKNIGAGAAQGISSFTTILVSFLWGILVFDESIGTMSFAVLGIICLAAGIAGMTISGSDMLEKFFAEEEEPQHQDAEVEKLLPPERRSANLYTLNISWGHPSESGTKTLIGVACSCLLGLTNGTMLVPIKYSKYSGQIFIVAFGTGVIVATIIFALVYFYVLIKFFDKRPYCDFKTLPMAGLASGFLWNIGNCCSVFATLYLGLAYGYPLAHTALFTHGVWSILLFNEIKGFKSIGLFGFSALITLGGAAFLVKGSDF